MLDIAEDPPQKKELLPVRIMALTPSSLDASWSLARSSSIRPWDRALRLAGRLKAKTTTPSAGVDAFTKASPMMTDGYDF
jgi:hypothetical protein